MLSINLFTACGTLLACVRPSNAGIIPVAPRGSLETRDLPPPKWNISSDVNTAELGDPNHLDWVERLTNVSKGISASFGDQKLSISSDVHTAADRTERLKRLNMVFPGIFWDKAYPDDQSQSCTFEQLNILEMATRTAVRMARYDPWNIEDAAFNRYFVTDGRVSGRWSNGDNRGHYLNVINNFKQVGSFPTKGDDKGRMLQKWRVAYLCGRIPEARDSCNNAEGPTKVLAYTAVREPNGPSPFGTVIIFCPSFFKLRFTDLITSGPKKEPTDLGSPDLITFEQTILHEYMHCWRPMGMSRPITDVDKENPNKAIYGASRCHERAWLNVHSSGNPNPEIVYNADNYAWTWQSREFERVWNWNDDGSTATGIDSDKSVYTTADISSNLTKPVDGPINCSGEGKDITCSYVGMGYNDYLLNTGTKCDCFGTICKYNSPACCASTTCGNCEDIKKAAQDPKDVPACCATNTCLWALGSNVNGPITSE